ncbi:MAG: type III-A CRISPR-associated protein Csm2 [Bacteroidota bacterium]
MMKLDFQELLRNVKKGKGDSTSNAEKLDKLNRRMILLKPKLAYAAGRQRKVKEVYQFVSLAIDGVKEASKHKNEQDWIDGLQNFFDLIESVVAYHKYYGDS